MGYSPSKQALQYSRLPPQAAKRPSSLRYVSLVVSDHTDIFIPFTVTSQKNYALPKIFDAVSDKKNIFTLKPGDLIVKGIIDFELTGEKGKNEKALLNAHDNVRVVKAVDTCDYGSGDMRHWEVVAV